MGRRSDPAFAGQPSQEGLNLRTAHLLRMPQAMEADVGPAPMHVDLFGAPAVVQQPDALAQLVEQPGRLQRWQRQRLPLPSD